MITFESVTKTYGEKDVLKKISFHIKEGEFAVLIGPSGCGKTTTLKMINRLIDPNGGQIKINGKNISEIDKVTLRRNIGYVIQQIGLFPNMTIEQNIAVVPKLLKFDKQKIKDTVLELMKLVNMDYNEYAKKYPNQLSGGQQQRIGVLRALAASPDIVLMDEPFGALDPLTREVLQEEVSKIQKKLKKTIIMVTHDMEEALKLADTIIFMDEGEIVQMDSPEEMLNNPSCEIVKSFLGKHIAENRQMKAEDFMKQRVFKIKNTATLLRAVDLMGKNEINSLIVVDKEDKFLGTVHIDDIRKTGAKEKMVEQLLSNGMPFVNREDDAKECFNALVNAKKEYSVVLNEDKTVAGIITHSSMARAMANKLWGDFE